MSQIAFHNSSSMALLEHGRGVILNGLDPFLTDAEKGRLIALHLGVSL